jgi:hypothetical protein
MFSNTDQAACFQYLDVIQHETSFGGLRRLELQKTIKANLGKFFCAATSHIRRDTQTSFAPQFKIFFEQNGLIGFTPLNMQVGDYICEFKKSGIVFVVRHMKDGTCSIVGRAAPLASTLQKSQFWIRVSKDLDNWWGSVTDRNMHFTQNTTYRTGYKALSFAMHLNLDFEALLFLTRSSAPRKLSPRGNDKVVLRHCKDPMNEYYNPMYPRSYEP